MHMLSSTVSTMEARMLNMHPDLEMRITCVRGLEERPGGPSARWPARQKAFLRTLAGVDGSR
jgi:hypothetical protein